MNRFAAVLLSALALALAAPASAAELQVERLTSAIPFPRGLALVDLDGDGTDSLYVLSRGRVRDSGGVSGAINDRAGTIWEVDPATGETTLFAEPTSPPFKLFDRTANPPSSDRNTDRPYCVLRWHEPTRSFYLCAFSGVDLAAKDKGPAAAEYSSFSKNYTDAVLRYDTRTNRWSEVDRHDPQYGAAYPGQDGRGFLKGPDNLVAVGDTLIVAAKDNSRLVAFDVSPLEEDPAADLPTPRIVLGNTVRLANRGGEEHTILGHSGLAYRDGWLYVAFRTTGAVIRVPVLDGAGPLTLDADRAELLAEFQPWDPVERKSANVTDIALGPDGDVYVVSAMPARIYRFTPDPVNLRDFVSGFETGQGAWADLSAMTDNPRMKSENVLVADDGAVYVTSGDAYGDAQGEGLGGTVWRISNEQ